MCQDSIITSKRKKEKKEYVSCLKKNPGLKWYCYLTANYYRI